MFTLQIHYLCIINQLFHDKTMIATIKQINLLKLDELLGQGKELTLEDILNAIPEMERRTFYNYRAELEKHFNAPLEVGNIGKESTYRYKVKGFSIREQFIQELNLNIKTVQDALQGLSLMSGDDVNNIIIRLYLMGIKNDLLADHRPFMAFDNNVDLTGFEYLEELGQAILDKQPLRIEYKPFVEDLQQLVIHPYFLKQYNNRWFLLAWSEPAGRIHNFALDRIQRVEPTDEVVYYPQPNNVRFDEYFDDIVGVTNYDDREVETIVLRVSRKSYDYIATKPLHWSQKPVRGGETEDWVTIQLRVKTNTEFEMLLLSYGDAIEVVEPQSLRETMKEKAERMAALYHE